jgi:hypothetical protein
MLFDTRRSDCCAEVAGLISWNTYTAELAVSAMWPPVGWWGVDRGVVGRYRWGSGWMVAWSCWMAWWHGQCWMVWCMVASPLIAAHCAMPTRHCRGSWRFQLVASRLEAPCPRSNPDRCRRRFRPIANSWSHHGEDSPGLSHRPTDSKKSCSTVGSGPTTGG